MTESKNASSALAWALNISKSSGCSEMYFFQSLICLTSDSEELV